MASWYFDGSGLVKYINRLIVLAAMALAVLGCVENSAAYVLAAIFVLLATVYVDDYLT